MVIVELAGLGNNPIWGRKNHCLSQWFFLFIYYLTKVTLICGNKDFHNLYEPK